MRVCVCVCNNNNNNNNNEQLVVFLVYGWWPFVFFIKIMIYIARDVRDVEEYNFFAASGRLEYVLS